MKLVLGIKKSHQVRSGRVLTIGVSRDTSMVERLSDDRVSLLFYSYVMPWSKNYEYSCIMVFHVFQGR